MEVNDFVLYDGTLYRVDNVHGDLKISLLVRPSYTSIISLSWKINTWKITHFIIFYGAI